MKKIKSLVAAVLLMLTAVYTIHAQVNVQNTGILYITGTPDILYINGSLTNASGAALTNNGNMYVLQNLSNAQSGMATGTGTLYLNGGSAQVINGSQLFRTFNLVTSNSAGIALNNDLSVSGVHTFTAGIIATSATPNYLQYEAGASYTGDGDTKHVKGWVRKTGSTNFIFPIGNGTVERTISVSGLSASSVFDADYAGITTNPSNLASPLVSVDPNEYWIVNKESGGTAVINMNWNNSKIAMPNYALTDIRVANYIGSNWTQVGGTAVGSPATTGTISSNTLSSFGSFSFGSLSFLLPVNLLDFYAYKNNGNVQLDWTTSDEINVSYYEVERSDDGIVFYSVGHAPARNAAGLQQYELTDTRPRPLLTWYRLRSVDIDGQSRLSKIITVNTGNGANSYLTVANPAHSSIRVNVQHINGVFAYRINTISGQAVQSGSLTAAVSGMYDIRLSAAIKPGLYILEIQKSGFNFSQRILIQ